MAVMTRGKTYPRFGANIWWELRDAFRKERPAVVDVAYLISQLAQSEKSARNLLPNFRALGLIDEAGRPTDLADLWRDDETYGRALDEMVRRAYSEVAEQFPSSSTDRSALERWFAATTGTGENSVRQMASFYLLLTSGDVRPATSSVETVAVNGAISHAELTLADPEPAPSEVPSDLPTLIETVLKPVLETEPALTAQPATAPVLHFHLHFTPDTSEAQVEALMRSVKKYL